MPQARQSLRRLIGLFLWGLGICHCGAAAVIWYAIGWRESSFGITMIGLFGLAAILIGFFFRASDDEEQEMSPDKYAPWKNYEEQP